MLEFTNLVTAAEASFAVVSVTVRSGSVASVLYLGVRAGNVAPGILGQNIVLAALIWIILPWFLVAVAWSNIVWVVVINIGMLGLIYCGIIAITFKPGVSGHDILLVA